LLLIITCDVSDFFFLSFLSQLKLKLTVAWFIFTSPFACIM
jgi:hypothetical protein